MRATTARLSCAHAPAQFSEGANKKTLGPDHVVTALQQLGFDDFVEEVETYWQQLQGGRTGDRHMSGAAV